MHYRQCLFRKGNRPCNAPGLVLKDVVVAVDRHVAFAPLPEETAHDSAVTVNTDDESVVRLSENEVVVTSDVIRLVWVLVAVVKQVAIG